MPRLAHAILYDADAKGRETLAYGFEVDGLKVTATAAVEEARALVTASPGEVVVVVVREGDPGGIPLARRLSENAETRSVPRLILADAPALPEALVELEGPAGFLPLPAFVRDVVTAAKMLASGAAGPDEATYEGALSDLGLFFIVRTMVGLGLSGIVEVERGTRKGELRFHEGEVDAAQIGSLEGMAALHQLLLWEEAALALQFRPTVKRGQPFPRGDELLDDCARFLRDFEHATRNIGHAQSLFVQDAEKTASLLDAVPSELVPVMRLFDGHRSLGDVIEDSPFRVFDTLRSVARLIELGTIRRKAIEKPTTGLSGQMKKLKPDDWLGRSAELPALSVTTPPPGSLQLRGRPGAAPTPGSSAPAPAESAAASETRPLNDPASHRSRRSFRRKTGEQAIAAAPAPGAPGPRAPFTPIGAALGTPGPRRPPTGGTLEARGELTATSREDRAPAPVADAPKVLVELGPDLAAVDESAEPAAPTTDVPLADTATTHKNGTHAETVPIPVPEPLDSTSMPREEPNLQAPTAAPSPAMTATPSSTPPGARPAGVHVAEIDTGMRPPPPPELLEAPAAGPSILIDPGFVEEMDAFELAHSQPTPPPVVATEAAPAAPAPADAAAAEAAGPVVSFVRGVAPPARAGLAHPSFNAAPTVPISAVPPARPPAARPEAAPTPAPAPAEPSADTSEPPASAAPAMPPPAGGPTPAPTASRPITGTTDARKGDKRRASGEFNSLEHEFFARESDLYKKEPVENFDDLDASKSNKEPPK